MDNTLIEIADALEHGRCKQVRELIRIALDEGHSSGRILESGLLKGMENVGRRFDREMVEIPELLAITRALNGGMDVLAQEASRDRDEKEGTVLIGTMRGDVHDIGKNLIRIMLESKGLRVVDLGVDVPAHRFVDGAIHERAQVVVCSGFLQESLVGMRQMVKEFEDRGIRRDIYIMVGGAALDSERARQIGADCYTENVMSCGEKAYEYCRRQKGRVTRE